MNRRNFLLNTGITAAGVLIGCDTRAANKPEEQLIGIQLFSLRDELKDGLDKVLAKIAKAGYSSVEMFGFNPEEGFFKNNVENVANLLKANNLASPSGHYMLDLFDKDGKKVIDAALALGHKYVVIPWFPPEQRSKLDDYRVIAEKINKAAQLCKESGLKMAYHNHDFEFTKYEDGVCGYDILTKEMDPEIDLEVDLYWVQVAQRDAVELFRKYEGRIKMWHVKDMDKADPKKQTEVGSGVIDFKTIFKNASLSGMKYFYVEQENLPVPGDANIKKSNDYVRKELLPLLKKG